MDTQIPADQPQEPATLVPAGDPQELLRDPTGSPAVLAPEPELTGTPQEFGLPGGSNHQQKACWDRQEAWLRAYRELGYKNQASEAVGISIWAVMKWQEHDLYGFNARVKLAYEQHTESWETGMDARLRTPAGNRGSDILYMFKLKAMNPEKYRETVTLTDNSGVSQILRRFDALARGANQASINKEAIQGQVRELPPAADSAAPS